MTTVRVPEWRKLPVSLAELCIDTTLRCGQSFRWKKSADDQWCQPLLHVLSIKSLISGRTCALHDRILSLRQDSTHLHYRATWPERNTATLLTSPLASTASDDEDDTESLIRHYFNLNPNLTQLYEQWSQADSNFKKRAPRFTGVRILKQDPWETLVGFICSSNNNIARISQMVGFVIGFSVNVG